MRRRRGGPARVRRVEKRKDERLKKRREEKREALLSGKRNEEKRDKKMTVVKVEDVEEMKVDAEVRVKQSGEVESEVRTEIPEIGLAVQGKAWCEEPARQSWGPAGSFNRCLSAWEQLPGVSEQVLEWIRYGVRAHLANQNHGTCGPARNSMWQKRRKRRGG